MSDEPNARNQGDGNCRENEATPGVQVRWWRETHYWLLMKTKSRALRHPGWHWPTTPAKYQAIMAIVVPASPSYSR